ncbi:nitrilase-related carbon-nitrogen hydrolase [Streptomyces sp. NPDC090106]|uniref:nitrilase-related carbon-nitrogen hydrolase n=1 Tax=Streptomyces sp. NPDC090106 TaxID=3365946 RepID=UPI0038055732
MALVAGSVRVAAAQFAVGEDRKANLAAVLRAIDAAAAREADLVVLPEFCNHLSWYRDRAHALREACRLGDTFLSAVAGAAAGHRIYVKVHVTLATEAPGTALDAEGSGSDGSAGFTEVTGSDGAVGTIGPPVRDDGMRITAASLLIGPDGRLLGRADKQTLMGSENDHLDPADTVGPVLDTPLGRLGLYSCMEGVINEVCRGLALRGAQVLLNSLNSFAVDEASLHIPVRAAENKVWVVAANKVGPLIPENHLAAVASGLGIPPEALHGAGGSQIVRPDGTVAAEAPAIGEAVVVADIEPAAADDKRRPDGTDLFAARRPWLYGPVARPPRPAPPFAARRADTVTAAVLRPDGDGPNALREAVAGAAEAVARGARLLVLPELFLCPGGTAPVDTAPDEGLAATAVRDLADALTGTDALIACTLPEAGVHTGFLIGAHGPVLRMPQLHPSARHSAWATEKPAPPVTHDAPWGRVALVVGDDTLYPETFRLAALAGADTVAVCYSGAEPWERTLGLPERAAENRVNVVAAGHGEGAIHALPGDFGLWQSRDGGFTGRISHPLVTTASGPLTLAPIHPAQALRRMVSRNTDLVDGRPWRLSGALTSPDPGALTAPDSGAVPA